MEEKSDCSLSDNMDELLGSEGEARKIFLVIPTANNEEAPIKPKLFITKEQFSKIQRLFDECSGYAEFNQDKWIAGIREIIDPNLPIMNYEVFVKQNEPEKITIHIDSVPVPDDFSTSYPA